MGTDFRGPVVGIRRTSRGSSEIRTLPAPFRGWSVRGRAEAGRPLDSFSNFSARFLRCGEPPAPASVQSHTRAGGGRPGPSRARPPSREPPQGAGGRTDGHTRQHSASARRAAAGDPWGPGSGAGCPAGGAPPPFPATPAHSGARDWLRPPLAARRSPPPSQLKQTVPGAERARREHGPRAAAAPAPAPPPPSPPRTSLQLQPRPRPRSARLQPPRFPRLSAAPARSRSPSPSPEPAQPAAAAAAGRGRGRCCRSRRRRRRRLGESRAAPRRRTADS